MPSGIVATEWPAVRDTCAGFGVGFDMWQDGAGRSILAVRKDGKYACSIGGAVLSIPRQVGKTFLIGAIVFALCLLHPGLTVLWTAHRLRTANETFSKMQAFARRKKVAPHVAKVVLGSGDEEIKFHNGSRILFGARERGFGRGFDDVDVEVFDEAQILTENAIDDMVPATNTAKNPLLLFTGTPPKPTDPSEVFRRKRKEALDSNDPDTLYIEFSADEGSDPNDREQWSKANPSYPTRTNAAAMLRMRKNLSTDSFVREGLGIWDPEDSGGEIDMGKWARLDVGLEDERPSPVAFAVEVSTDRKWATILLAGYRKDGKRHLQVVESGKGTGWLPDRLDDLVRTRRPVGVGLNPAGPAGSLLPELANRKIAVTEVTGRDLGQATGMLLDGVEEETIAHSSQPLLTISADAVKTRMVGNGTVKVLDMRGVTDIAPLNGVAIALFVLETVKPITTRAPRRLA